MFRFNELVRRGEVVRDVKQRHPETEAVFRKFGLRPACDDCSIEEAARRAGIPAEDLLLEINETIYRSGRVSA